MRLLDLFRNDARTTQDLDELKRLRTKLSGYTSQAAQKRAEVCQRVLARVLPDAPDTPVTAATLQLCEALLAYEGHFTIPELTLDRPLSTGEVWELSAIARARLGPFERAEVATRIEEQLTRLLQILLRDRPPDLTQPDGEAAVLSVPFHAFLSRPAYAVEEVMGAIIGEPGKDSLFPRLWRRLELNLLRASGIDPERAEESRKQPTTPTKAKDKSAGQLVEEYLAGTPFAEFLQTPLPFSIPFPVRFEHTHIVGGSGHGKTQLLQQLILKDLDQLKAGRGSVIVIDSQGDMIRTITHLAEFAPTHPESLADRLVLIDPNDIEHPPCLNLFDFGLERLESYSVVEREKLLNGAIALYEYMFGALLGADLTQRQGVIFRYLGRLLMTVPGATIHTLREFMEDPEAARPYVRELEGSARHFFATQFFSDNFKDTRQQILNRLWGILSNPVLERLFSHERNKVNLFEAMNRGKVVLINTAKDLLKQEGCSILGRFFIALITQAAQERAAIPADWRRATFLYIDEAQDYFDQSIEQLFNQARKYRVGLIVAHQNLGQFGRDLAASVMASTAIKLAGGVSAKDAAAIGKEMRCEPEFLQDMRKRGDRTEFACFVKSVTPSALRLSVPFGVMEGRPRLPDADYDELLELNRARYSAEGDPTGPGIRTPARPASGFQLGEHEVF